MEDKTFAGAVDELQLRSLKAITDEVLCCWPKLQQGMTVHSATAHIENEHMKATVTHTLFYILLQSLLFEARSHHLIQGQRYDELRRYIDTLTSLAKQDL